MDDFMLDNNPVVPYICLFDQLDRALSTLQVENMKSVEHEDEEFNNDFSVDPLADPRLDKMDLFNVVDYADRDKIMNAQSSFNVADVDFASSASSDSNSEPATGSGSGE